MSANTNTPNTVVVVDDFTTTTRGAMGTVHKLIAAAVHKSATLDTFRVLFADVTDETYNAVKSATSANNAIVLKSDAIVAAMFAPDSADETVTDTSRKTRNGLKTNTNNALKSAKLPMRVANVGAVRVNGSCVGLTVKLRAAVK